MKYRLRALALVSASVLASCGGSGEGLDENGRPGMDNGSTLTADLRSIQDHVFTPICTACHAGAAAPLGFRLDEASAYAMLVNAPSVEVPSLLRVRPGQPDASYIIQKLEGHAAVGGQMPLGQSPLPQATIDIIRQWIANGAAPATAAATSAPATMQVVVPLEDEIFTRSAGDPLITADGALDPATLNSANLVVERSASGKFDDGSATAVQGATIEIRSIDPAVFAVVLPPAERLPGNYRITIRGTDLVLQYTIEDLQ